MVTLLTLVIEHYIVISIIIIITIIFLYFFEKNNTIEKKDMYSQKEISKKNLYLNRIDIIANKVQFFISLIIATFSLLIYWFFS